MVNTALVQVGKSWSARERGSALPTGSEPDQRSSVVHDAGLPKFVDDICDQALFHNAPAFAAQIHVGEFTQTISHGLAIARAEVLALPALGSDSLVGRGN
jgi:hypothetical protein